jgi:hypothetical protein
MAGFTDEEVQATVDRLLLTRVSVPRLKTGSRDVLALRSTVFDLLTTALLLRPDSYFYLVWLAKNRLRRLVSAQEEALVQIAAQWAQRVSAPAKAVGSTAELVNAQAALLELDAGRATGARGGTNPAVARFRRSVERFISSELTKNVVFKGEVVETADEARAHISAAWAKFRERDVELLERAARIDRALVAFSAARLPETSIRGIIGRLRGRLVELQEALEGPTAVRDSRGAFLELMAMRILLAKAAAFQHPRLLLAPRPGDSTSGVLIDSPGVPAALIGAVSAPYRYASGSTFSLSVHGVGAVVSLPGASGAELRSQSGLDLDPAAPGELHVEFDRLGTKTWVVAVPGGGFADGGALAAALNTQLNPEVVASYDAVADQVVLQSAEVDFHANIQIYDDTAARGEFAIWFLGGHPREAGFRGVEATEVVEQLHTTVPTVHASAPVTVYATFMGECRGGDPNTLWDVLVEGADLATTGMGASSPTTNFEALGVRPGMGLEISVGPAAGVYTIDEVAGDFLKVNAPMSAASAYHIGPDYRTVPAGARVRATGGRVRQNSGVYGVTSGQVGRFTLARPFYGPDDQIRAVVSTAFLRLEARGTTTSSGITVPGASAGATALGLPVSAGEVKAHLSALQVTGVDFPARGVKEGDLLTLTAPSGEAHETTLVAVTANRLVFTPAVPHAPGSWYYRVHSARYQAFLGLQAAVQDYCREAGERRRKLELAVGQMLRGAWKDDWELEEKGALVALRNGLDAYSVEKEQTIDNVVRTLREQGFDRALDMLLVLDIEGCFSMSEDGVSYSSHLVRTAATVAREVVPVSKEARGPHVAQQWRPVSSQPNPFDPLDEGGT